MATAMLLAVPRASSLLRRCRSEGMTGAGRLTDLGGEKGGPSDDDGGGTRGKLNPAPVLVPFHSAAHLVLLADEPLSCSPLSGD